MREDYPDPRVNDWYRDAEDRLFRVVAVNDGDQTIEVQMQDGTIEEMDLDDWFEVGLEAAEEPDDWSAQFDDLERDEVEEADSAMNAGRRGNPLDGMSF